MTPFFFIHIITVAELGEVCTSAMKHKGIKIPPSLLDLLRTVQGCVVCIHTQTSKC
jgi:hypothetical protein